MTTAELLAKVRRIEIKAKSMSTYTLAGEYHSKYKGQGMSFTEVREYAPGDDVRNIDWNVTARMRTPYVKVFEEEREMTIMLMIDVSQSTLFGMHKVSKKDLIAEISATIAFSASNSGDKVGVIFFSNKIEQFIPPNKGKKHILNIIRSIIMLKPTNVETDLSIALEFMASRFKQKTVTLLLSDLISPDYSNALRKCAFKHEVTFFKIYDDFDQNVPDVGLLKIIDSETGEMKWVDTSNKQMTQRIRMDFDKNIKAEEARCINLGADYMTLNSAQNYTKLLHAFFRKR